MRTKPPIEIKIITNRGSIKFLGKSHVSHSLFNNFPLLLISATTAYFLGTAPLSPPVLNNFDSPTKAVKLILTSGHISLAVAFKGPNVILGLCNVTTLYQLSESSALPPSRNKVLGWIKQSGGLDSTHGPCVCHLCP